jgi:2,4-dienoyl-CoA reductase-like NADH-dependent reductase (Old Yellow Enzyme family)
MINLFEPSDINGLTLPNRFVRAATWEGMAAANGACTPKLINLMAGLAKGGVGLIITSHAFVQQDGQVSLGQLGVYDDALIPDLKRLTQTVHQNGGKIFLQLAHAGLYADPKLTGQPPAAVSAVDGFVKSAVKEMRVQEIQKIVTAFAAAAKRAHQAKFDGVQLHAAHGYLFNQFLSPLFNRRNDDYGGRIENRARALLEALRAVRKAVGRNYPIIVKLNCQDFVENGLSLEDSIQAGVMLSTDGVDAIEVSGGNRLSGKLGPVRVGIKSEKNEAYFQKEARMFKEKIKVPIILVGGNRSFQMAERLVNEGVADYISMSRPLIREPDLINRWKSGDVRKPACVSDNLCYRPAIRGDGIYCLTEERERAKQSKGD